MTYTEKELKRDDLAKDYQDLLAKNQSPEAMAKRKQTSADTAFKQTQALAGEKANQAAAQARRQGMTKGQAAMYGGDAATKNMTADFTNTYGTALAQENLAAQQQLEMAKAAYENQKELTDDKWDKGLSIFSTIFGVLSDERLKDIHDKWKSKSRKNGGCSK